MNKETASSVIRHFEKERERYKRLFSGADILLSSGLSHNSQVDILMDVKFLLMGRHVLCEKDFTKKAVKGVDWHVDNVWSIVP